MSAETAVKYEQGIRRGRASGSFGQSNGIAGLDPIWGGSPLNLCINMHGEPVPILGETWEKPDA